MPLYQLFCLSRPAGGRAALSQMIRAAGQTVLSNNGVLTDVTYYGEQKLAYEIRKTGIKFGTADIWQLEFQAAPAILSDLRHNLKVDERILRYVVQKQRTLPRLPNSHSIGKQAMRLAGPAGYSRVCRHAGVETIQAAAQRPLIP